MVNFINLDDTDVLAVEVSGKLTKQDYDKMLPAFENKIRKEGRIKSYIEFGDFDMIKPGALWQELKFDVKHFNDFSRIAVVGDKKWMEWMTRSIKPFTSAEVRYFTRSDRVLAKQWLSEDVKQEEA